MLGFGGVLAAFWRRFGGVLASFWQRFGGVLASFWRRFGIVLARLLTLATVHDTVDGINVT